MHIYILKLSKIDIVKNFINTFEVSSNCSEIYCLVDTWYTNTPLIESTLSAICLFLPQFYFILSNTSFNHSAPL